MKIMMFAAATAVLTLAGAQAAKADSFLPANSVFVFNGTADVTSQALTINCGANLTIESNLLGDDAEVSVTTLSGSMICGLCQFLDLPWNVDITAPASPGASATKLAFRGVKLKNHLTGGICGPEDIEVTWSPGSPTRLTTPIGTEINPPTPGCRFVLDLYQVAGPSPVFTK